MEYLITKTAPNEYFIQTINIDSFRIIFPDLAFNFYILLQNSTYSAPFVDI